MDNETKTLVLNAFSAGWKAHLSKHPGTTLADHQHYYLLRLEDSNED